MTTFIHHSNLFSEISFVILLFCFVPLLFTISSSKSSFVHCSTEEPEQSFFESSPSHDKLQLDEFNETSTTTSEESSRNTETNSTLNEKQTESIKADGKQDSLNQIVETITKYNCTPVQRNNTPPKLILVNSSEIPSFIQLKNFVIVDPFYLNHSTYSDSKRHQNDNDSKKNHSEMVSDGQTDGTNRTIETGKNSTTKADGEQQGQCVIMIFYYNWCRFSAAAAPQFNALGRLYPQMYIIAVDAYHHYSVTIRFGVSGVPSIYFLYNGRAVAKYNKTDITMDGLFDFIRSLTSLEPTPPVANVSENSATLDADGNEVETVIVENSIMNQSSLLNVTDEDRLGPLVINLNDHSNYLLIVCWIFCLVCFVYHFVRSALFTRIKDHIRIMWNEAQTVQHEHID